MKFRVKGATRWAEADVHVVREAVGPAYEFA